MRILFYSAMTMLLLGTACRAQSLPPGGAPVHLLTATAEPPFPNPLKGLIPFYDSEPQSFPHSMEWVYCRLSDVVVGVDKSGNNVYDWRKFDGVLDAVAKRGHQACVRFYTYYPGDASQANAMPAFLHPRTFPWQDGETKRDVPDFNDPEVVRCLTQFIAALGARYDRSGPNPRIGFITAGLLGFWGEWHVYTGLPDWDESAMLNNDTKGKIARAFQDSFRNIPVLLRYPLSAEEQKSGAELARFGYHDDSFVFATVGTPDWYFANRMRRAKVLQSESGIWRTHPIGGEIYPESQNDVFHTGSENYGKWAASVAAVHPTWMIAARVFQDNPTSKAKDYANARKESARLGYNIRATRAYFAKTLTRKEKLYVGVKLANDGVAPFYYPWKMQVGLREQGTDRIITWDTNWDIRRVSPGTTEQFYEFTCPVPEVSKAPPGTYDLVLAVVNPLSFDYPKALPFLFANEEQGSDGWLLLGSIRLSP